MKEVGTFFVEGLKVFEVGFLESLVGILRKKFIRFFYDIIYFIREK